MTYIPAEDASKKAKRESGSFALDLATVKRVRENDDHQVVIEIVSSDREAPEPVPAAVTGDDIALPSVGDMVVVGYARGEKAVVLGRIYKRQDNPSYSAGERRIRGRDGVFIDGPFGVVPTLTADPSSPPDGAVWYRSDLDEYRGVEGGTTVSFDTTAV